MLATILVTLVIIGTYVFTPVHRYQVILMNNPRASIKLKTSIWLAKLKIGVSIKEVQKGKESTWIYLLSYLFFVFAARHL